MDYQETAKILGVIKANYRNMYKDMSTTEGKFLVELWHKIFKNTEYTVVSEAVERFITRDAKGFPPAIGQITDIIYKMSNEYQNELTAEQAWHCVLSVLKNCGMHATREYNKMSPVLQKLVGNAERLRAWAYLDNKTLETSVKYNLLESYKILLERQKYETSIDNLKIVSKNNLKTINDR